MQKKLGRDLKNYKKLSLILGLFLSLFVYSSVHAATLSLSPSSGSYNVGDTINVRLYVSSPSESINAVSSAVVFSNDTLALSSISKSGSIINYWADGPSFVNSSGQAKLDGVAFSGFSGSSGTVVTFNFKAVAEGTAYVRFSNSSVLANDGAGTNVLTGSTNASFSISKAQVQNTVQNPIISNIVKKPEAQIPTLQNSIKIEEIRSISNEKGRVSFLIIPPRPAVNNAYDIQIDSEETFSYVDEGYRIYQTNVLTEGNHTITVNAKDQKGNKMSGVAEFTVLPLGVSQTEFALNKGFGQQFSNSPDVFTKHMFTILGVLVLILILGFVKIHIAKKALNKKITDAKKVVSKTFNLLEEDEDEENKLIRKLKSRKSLSEDDEATIDQFSKDLGEAEKVITETLNDIKHND